MKDFSKVLRLKTYQVEFVFRNKCWWYSRNIDLCQWG